MARQPLWQEEACKDATEALVPGGGTASIVAGVGKYLPERVITSEYIEKAVGFQEKFGMPPGIIEQMTGVRERRYIEGDQVSSDMACEASKIALENAGVSPRELEVIIFASASHDIAEPATANILQAKLGAVNAHCMDAKNACNSFLNGVDIMDAFIKTGRCRVGLVAAGEVLSKFVRWEIETMDELTLGFSAFTLGDGGGAAVFRAGKTTGAGSMRPGSGRTGVCGIWPLSWAVAPCVLSTCRRTTSSLAARTSTGSRFGISPRSSSR